jgi:poly(3-hydroxybutyrate) depolymerase
MATSDPSRETRARVLSSDNERRGARIGLSCGAWLRAALLAALVVCLPAPSAAVTKSAGCGKAGKPTGNFHLKTTDNRGTQRDYEVIVPTSYTPSTPLALSFVFHGGGGTQADAKRYGLQQAPGAGPASIFVFPQGVPYQNGGVGWDDSCGGYDVALFDKISSSLQSSYCIDTERVFVAGFSWGCDFATALACCRGNKVRAIAAASCSDDFRVAHDPQTYKQAPCPVSNNAAIRFTHATAGDWGYPAPYFATTSKLFQSFNGCSADSVAGNPPQCKTFRGCRRGLVECSYDNLGHALPATWAADSWSFFSATAGPPAAAAPLPAAPRFASAALALLLLGGGMTVLHRVRRGPR